MTALQKINLGTPPAAQDGDTNRSANTKFNANVDVLSMQAALDSVATVTQAQALTAADHLGKRVNINLAAAGVVNLPTAVTCAADSVILLRNIGMTVVTLAITAASGDTVALSKLNPGETALLDSDGVHAWSVLMRGRTGLDNETVNDNLAVGGAVSSASVAASGKVVGVNRPNLLLNGSAEFGVVGWSNPVFQAATNLSGDGTFFNNAAAIAATTSDVSAQIPVGANVALAISGDVYTGGLTAGHAYFWVEAFSAANASLGTVCSVGYPAAGSPWTFEQASGVTPANTTYVVVHKTVDGNPAVAAAGVGFRRIKLELGTGPSLYSQDASVAYLLGTPALAGRPTFAGKTPWDSGNLSPVDTTTAQNIGGQKTFTTRPIFNSATPWDTGNLPSPVKSSNNSFTLSWQGGYGVPLMVDSSSVGSLVFGDGHTMRLGWTGSIQAYVDSINVGTIQFTSDYRLKRNVKTLEASAVDMVKALRPVTFNLKDVSIFKDDGREHVGFLAHELKAIIDSSVDGERDAVDEEGNLQPQSLRWPPIVAVLTKALQEAFARIEALEATQ